MTRRCCTDTSAAIGAGDGTNGPFDDIGAFDDITQPIQLMSHQEFDSIA